MDLEIETLADWNAWLACCCQMPACPMLQKECQSITVLASPVGFINSADTVWTRYAVETVGVSYSQSISTSATEGVGTPYEVTYVGEEHTISASSSIVRTFDRLFSGAIAGGGECEVWEATMTEECVATGTETRITRDALFAASGSLPPYDLQSSRVVITSQTFTNISNVSGERTVDHIAWEAEGDAWDVANPDHEAAIAAWQADHNDWVDEVTAWEIAYQEWLDGGEVGDPPDHREEPVRPPDRPTEPTEFYPECIFKKTTEVTENDWAFYYDDEPAEVLVLSSATVTTSDQYIYGLPTWGGTATSTTEYTGAQDKAGWISATRAIVVAAIDFDSIHLSCLGSGCVSSIDVGPSDPEPEDPPLPPAPGPSPYVSIVASRSRWRVPSLIVPGVVTELDPTPDPLDWWRGNYFRVAWLTCFFPKAWEEWKALYDEWVAAGGIIPGPTHPGPQPTPPTLSVGGIGTWTGPGDPEVDLSWLFPGGWHELPTPATEGQNRIVNVQFYCYPDSPYGYAPQITGEAYEAFTEIPPPADP